MSLLEIENLSIRYGAEAVVDGLSLHIERGESIGLVGESGSGKTQTALAVLGLLPAAARLGGSIRIGGKEVIGASESQLNRLRAERVAIVFQDPLQALNPYQRIGRQLRQVLIAHGLARGAAADQRVLAMLARVGLPDPDRQARAFPHQLSGGMRQRVMLASALLTSPDLLIADEPTTSLDVTVQAQILELLESLRDETALLLITHDLGIVAGTCERLAVLDAGRLVETGPTRRVFAAPESRRMAGLISVAPRLDRGSVLPPVSGEPVFEVCDAGVRYRERNGGRALNAVRGLGFDLRRGETLAIVGESGSGKSSLVRAALGLVPLVAGQLRFGGETLPKLLVDRPLSIRRELQLVFQDPAASLNPRMQVTTIVAEPLAIHRPDLDADARRDAVAAMLDRVGLGQSYYARYPHELSGGQAQRVALARALVTEPSVLVCDEAVSALDGRVRQQILALLREIQQQTGLAIVFISHDLAVVRAIAHRVLVVYLGRHVELASAANLFTKPQHPYTRALIDAVPVPDPVAGGAGTPLPGEPPSILNPPSGCAFEPRCRFAHARCAKEAPIARSVRGARVACHRADELELGRQGRAVGTGSGPSGDYTVQR